MTQKSSNTSRAQQVPGYRINFRLNPDRPKEQVILSFLQHHLANYSASSMIKAMLYEKATGRSWVTDRPLAQELPSEYFYAEPPKPTVDEAVLDDIIAGLDDWMNQ